MPIEIKGQSDFKHQFFVDVSDSAGSGFSGISSSGSYGEIKQWCLDNCKGRYIISSSMSLNVYHPVPAASPFPNQSFKPSTIEVRGVCLISFEDEEEATGFKMTFLNSASD